MKKNLLATCAIAALALFAAKAQAADVTAPEDNSFYVSLFGGASFLHDVDFDFYDGDYTVETKAGYILGGALGMRVWDPLRAEVELSYARWSVDDATADYGFGDVDAEGRGHLSATYLLGNLWYDFESDSSFTPYLGGGAGVAFVSPDVTFFGSDSFGLQNGEAGFAFQLGGGVKFGLTDNIALDIGYRFKGILDTDFDSSENGPFTGGDLFSHNIQGGIVIDF